MRRPALSGPESNIWKYYTFQFLLNFQLWWPIWVIYLTEQRGLSLGQVTLIDVPFWATIVFLQIPSAAVADRWGRKPTLIAAGLSMAVAVTLFGVASSFWLLLLSYLIWGISFSLLFGAESAFIFDSLKSMGRENEYSKIYGRAWGLATAAMLAGTLIGAPLADSTNLSVPIIVSGGIAGLAALFAITLSEPEPMDRSRKTISYAKIIGDSAQLVRTRPAVRYSILFYGLITVGSIAPVILFQPFLIEHDVDIGDVGFWQTPTRVAGIVGAVAAHRLILAAGERATFYAMPVVLIFSYLMLGLWDSLYAQIAFPLMNFVVILSQPTVTDYLNRRVPTEQRATVISLTNLARSAVLILAAPLLGLLADEASLATSFIVAGALVAGFGLPLMALWSPFISPHRGAETIEAEPASKGGD
ncbi:MAG: MFS transporter [Chloroflexi bacterium]|nr:MFS transporter [Chloroflexota bacterium]